MSTSHLLAEVSACTHCKDKLPHEPRPVLQFHPRAKVLIAGQAPGSRAHVSGIPFDDASGQRLRTWLGLSAEQFYRPELFSILPMGFCYPGRGETGDLPPLSACAMRWRESLLSHLSDVRLTLVIGKYAQDYHLPDQKRNLTETVFAWREYWPNLLPLPHPSPRNNRWFARHPWFEQEVLPALKQRVSEIMTDSPLLLHDG